MRVVLYTCLASATPQEVEAERAECEQIALATGCQIIGHIRDQSLDRDGLGRLLNTAPRAKGINALVVTSIDQLSLDPARLQQITARLNRQVFRSSHRNPASTTPTSESTTHSSPHRTPAM